MDFVTELRPADQNVRPELADIGRLTRRFMSRTIAAARAEESSVSRLIAEHLGPGTPSVAKAIWPQYDRVNVQVALNAWLAEPGREHAMTGITGYRHRDINLPDMMQPGHYHQSVGSVETEALPAGPGGVTLPCVQIGLYLTGDPAGPAVLLLRGPEDHGSGEIVLEVAGQDQDRPDAIVAEIKRLAAELNVFRGHVIEFGDEVFEYNRGSLLSFVDRPAIARAEVILPDEVLDGIERQVLGVARHAPRLRASGQHLRRGVLLYGVPGTGKTHTLRYLLSGLPGVTAVLLSGRALGMISAACSVARALQPCLIVVEDVDLIAEERDRYEGQSALLFELLNEMDGLGQDIDVTFLLTTNRADLLEEALAARPGRVDHAVELPVPDADARARLVRLYQGNLELELTDLPTVITRTEGVTASFIKELLRRAALAAAEADAASADSASADSAIADDVPIRVTDEHMATALDQLLDTRSMLTQVLLGGPRRRQDGPSSLAKVSLDSSEFTG
jgi:ATPase family associated with various cellular activities (AAA)